MARRTLSVLSGIILLSLLVAAMPFASGCAPKPAVEVEVEKIATYLSLSDLTGPTAGMRAQAEEMTEAYVDEVNEKGGVDGVKINFILIDTRYDTARAVAAYKRYRGEPNLLYVQPPSTEGARALAPQWERDKVVGYVPPDGYFQAFPSRMFLWGPCYQDAFAGMLDWAVADWKAKGKPGMPTIGHIGWDSAYGQEPLHGGIEYAEKLGVTVLPPEFFPTGALKHDVYLTRLASAGANYIHVGGVDPTPSNVIRDAHALGLTKDIQFIADFWGPNEAVGVRAHPEALEGTVIYGYFLRGEEAREHPFTEVWVKRGLGNLADMPDMIPLGVTWVRGFEFGLREALKDVSYEELDGEALFQGLKRLTGVDVNDGFTGPCAWSETDRRGSKLLRFYQVQDSKIVPITGWVEAPDAVSLYEW